MTEAPSAKQVDYIAHLARVKGVAMPKIVTKNDAHKAIDKLVSPSRSTRKDNHE